MTEKEEKIFNEIKTYYLTNLLMPSIRTIQKKLDYKSSTSIYEIFNSLEKKGYLKRNNANKLVINENILINTNIKKINVINKKNEIIYLLLNKTKNYLAFQIKNNYFENYCIQKDDYLIIEITNNIKNNQLGLFIINDKYRIMKYQNKDNFYLLSDFETIIVYKYKIIGKVIYVHRKIKDFESSKS